MSGDKTTPKNAIQKLSIKIDDLSKVPDTKRNVKDLKTPPNNNVPQTTNSLIGSWKNYHPKENHHYFAKGSIKSSCSSNEMKKRSKGLKSNQRSPNDLSHRSNDKIISQHASVKLLGFKKQQRRTKTILDKKIIPVIKTKTYERIDDQRYVNIKTVDLEMEDSNCIAGDDEAKASYCYRSEGKTQL